MYSQFVLYLGSYSTEKEEIHSGLTLHDAYTIRSYTINTLSRQGIRRHGIGFSKPKYSVSSVRWLNDNEGSLLNKKTVFSGMVISITKVRLS